MQRITTWRRLALLLTMLSLLAVGCRESSEPSAGGGEDPPEEAESEDGGDTESTDGSEQGGEVATDVGVTEEPCPDAVNSDNGCIYLGSISDLTVGPFATLGPEITRSQEAFWGAVNDDGGIGGYDVDVTSFVEDNLYEAETHNQVYQEMKGDVLALAQTLGSPTTAAIIDDLNSEGIVAAPASWTSAWAFEPAILESGNNYCIESMNSIDYALEQGGEIASVMAIHYPGDYGDDAAAGARIGAEANGLEFIDVETGQGQDNQAGAVEALVTQSPDLLIITTGPADMATVVGGAAAQGFQGQVFGTSPTWNPGLLETPALPALEALYTQSSPWATYASDTPGHERMREALGEDGNDGLTSGWAWSYPLRDALEAAAESGDLTREGLLAAAESLDSVDYEGMLPDDSGNYSGTPDESLVRGTVFQDVDTESSTGVSVIDPEFYVGPTAESYDIGDTPCFLQEG